MAWLEAESITQLVDVRSLPGSNKFPQFNQERLKISLENYGIEYFYLKELGGRRKYNKQSHNTIWYNKSFRAYADYMETNEFDAGLQKLKNLATEKPTVVMCAEAVWWRCHRSMIADALKVEGWKVEHIMGLDKTTDHPFTKPAKIVGGKLIYGEEEQ